MQFDWKSAFIALVVLVVGAGQAAAQTPTLTGISPASGSIAGGTLVTLNGTNFAPGNTMVTMDGNAIIPASITGTTSLTFNTPAHAPGNVVINVTTPAGTSNNAVGGFTYQTLAPTLSGVSPGTGSASGGTSITLSGSNLTGTTSVTVGGVAATNVTVVNDSTVTATVPAYVSGSLIKDVAVSNGATNATLTGAFTYQASSPTLSSLSPGTGSIAGGTSVTVSGTGFTPSTTLTIGGIAATSVTIVNSTTLTAVTPAYVSGSLVKDVVVNNGVGSASLVGGFTYQPVAPTIAGISPNTGSMAGGTLISVTGTGFVPSTTVTVGGVAATSVTISNATTLTAVVPAYVSGSLNADVGVNNGAGSATLVGGFTYQVLAPTITNVTPNIGSTAGGVTITTSGTGFVPGTTLTIGGIAANSVNIVNSTTLTAVVPAYVSGSLVKDVVVNNGAGSATLVNGFTYAANAPTLTAVSPNTGTTAGGTAITVTGTAFTPSTALTIGGVSANSVTIVNSTTLTAVTPAYVSGSLLQDVTVNNGISTATLANGFTYVAVAPTFTAVSPNSGTTAGGTTITVTGAGFVPGTTITVGGLAAISVIVINSTTLTAVTPAYVSGSLVKDVVVNNGAGSATLAASFSYVAPAPTITGFSPNSGSIVGGTTVTVTGSSFTPSTTLTLDGIAASSVTVVNSTTLTAISPAHAPGSVNAVVDNGVNTATLNGAFTYMTLAPTLTGVSPPTGPVAGGTTITLNGTNLTGTTSVTVGGVAATSVVVANNTTVTAVVPAYVSGSLVKDVVVGDGSTNATLVSAFTYQPAAPTLTAIAPNSGPIAGGTVVTVTGTGFTPSTTLTLGGVAATSVTVVNSTTLTGVTPAHAQANVDVVVDNGVASATLLAAFSYGSPPATLTGITPASGPLTGGTSVTISGTNLGGVTSVTIGAVAATSVTVVNATTVTATTPAYASGSLIKDVVVNGGAGSAMLPAGFTYQVTSPTLTGIAPNTGSTAGGTPITVSGTGFTPSTTLTIGGVAGVSVAVFNSTTLVALTPAYLSGSLAKDVVVNNGAGSATLVGGFTYQALAPTLAGIAPNSGSTAGGTAITVTGTGFTPATTLTVGGIAATSVVIVNGTTLTAVTPAFISGSPVKDVVVNNGVGSATLANGFTYQSSAPTLTGLSPNSGSATGGTAVTITGSNFTGTTAVAFGGSAATSFAVVSATTITAVTPAHAMGAVDVSVTTPAGAVTKTGAFTYTMPSDSAKLRALQVMATAMAAQASGATISGAVDGAISQGFSDGAGGPVTMTPGGMRFNFSADVDDGSRRANSEAGAAKRSDHPGPGGSRIDDAFASLDLGRSTKAPTIRPMKEWLGWAEISGSVVNRWGNPTAAPGAAALYGNQVNALIGLTRKLAPEFLVGAFGGYETFDYRSDALQGRLKGDGWTVGAYLGWKIAPHLRFDAAAAYSGIGYDGTAGTATGAFEGKRFLLSSGLIGDFKAWAVTVEPSAKIYALWEREGAYTDSLGTPQAARHFGTGRASAGAKLIYPFATDSGVMLAPYAGVYSDYYFNSDDAAASTPAGLAPVAASPILSGWSARAVGGLASRWSNGAQIEAGAELGGVGSSSHTRIWTYRAKGSVPF